MNHDICMLLISQIKIGSRHRKDIGDLDTLAASIEIVLLQPIGVTPEMDLIWGLRRLVATRDILKWQDSMAFDRLGNGLRRFYMAAREFPEDNAKADVPGGRTRRAVIKHPPTSSTDLGVDPWRAVISKHDRFAARVPVG